MQTIFNPNEARAFSHQLEQRSRELAARNTQVHKRFVDLRKTWQDHKYDAFAKVFAETKEHLAIFLDHAEKYGRYLNAKAVICDKYLSR